MNNFFKIIAGIIFCLGSALNSATAEIVTVNGASGPWDITTNPAYSYGWYGYEGGALASSVVSSSTTTLAFVAGDALQISYVDGLANAGGNGIWNDAQGVVWWPTNNGAPGQSYPLPPQSYPGNYISGATIYLEELLGAFANASGVIIAKPFVIGDYAALVIPTGASELLLGFNDNGFIDNGGSVNMNIIESAVSAVPIPASAWLFVSIIAGFIGFIRYRPRFIQ